MPTCHGISIVYTQQRPPCTASPSSYPHFQPPQYQQPASTQEDIAKIFSSSFSYFNAHSKQPRRRASAYSKPKPGLHPSSTPKTASVAGFPPRRRGSGALSSPLAGSPLKHDHLRRLRHPCPYLLGMPRPARTSYSPSTRPSPARPGENYEIQTASAGGVGSLSYRATGPPHPFPCPHP